MPRGHELIVVVVATTTKECSRCHNHDKRDRGRLSPLVTLPG